jgi:hypothetical protein
LIGSAPGLPAVHQELELHVTDIPASSGAEPPPAYAAFPLRRVCFSRRDRAELRRWGLAARPFGWFVRADLETGRLIEVTDLGQEYAVLSQGVTGGGWIVIAPVSGGWELVDEPQIHPRTFRTLRMALESVCRTMPALGEIT